jgi:hypothetical protein
MASEIVSQPVIPDSASNDRLNIARRGGFHGQDPGIQLLICL